MREIKFRAWDTINKSMSRPFGFDSDFLKNDGSKLYIPYCWDNEESEQQGLDEGLLEIMQFTGFLDKNGEEIYIGDIVHAIADEGWSENTIISDIVENKTDSFSCVVRSGAGYTNGLHLNWGGWESIEVIGNIYENSDLLISNPKEPCEQ